MKIIIKIPKNTISLSKWLHIAPALKIKKNNKANVALIFHVPNDYWQFQIHFHLSLDINIDLDNL